MFEWDNSLNPTENGIKKKLCVQRNTNLAKSIYHRSFSPDGLLNHDEIKYIANNFKENDVYFVRHFPNDTRMNNDLAGLGLNYVVKKSQLVHNMNATPIASRNVIYFMQTSFRG